MSSLMSNYKIESFDHKILKFIVYTLRTSIIFPIKVNECKGWIKDQEFRSEQLWHQNCIWSNIQELMSIKRLGSISMWDSAHTTHTP